jgi:oligosaccharyltransferase complex subunit alpha (ribophorin I)
VYTGLLYAKSPYDTDKMDIRYRLPSEKYESATDIQPFKTNDNLLTYGPFKDIPAFSETESIRIHFPSNAKFITFDKFLFFESFIVEWSGKSRFLTGETLLLKKW